MNTVINHYGLMGPAKAALESTVRCLAADLGPARITVNAISAGPVPTRAASGLDHFESPLSTAAERAPEHTQITIDDVGAAAVFLASAQARRITGSTLYVDAGYHVMG